MQGNNLDHDLIGENMHNGPPINRNQIYQTNKCPGQFYEWSELKSSYFVKNIIKDQTYNSVLVNRMKTHAQYLSGICNLNFDNAIREYLSNIELDGRKDNANPYPVGQMHMFKNEPPARLLNDFYALYNFNKFLFVYSIGRDVLTNHNNNNLLLNVNLVTFRFYYNIIQQKIFRMHQTIRGDRVDLQYSSNDTKDVLGITNNRYINDENNPEVYIGQDGLGSTVLKSNEFPSKNVINWQHPGINSCRPYFNGKYGQKIKEYVENPTSIENFFSSLQCGISASTNYVVFPLLFSIGKPSNVERNNEELVEDIIIMAVLGLCGDGGHNLREVLTGITSTFELCKIMSDKFLLDLSSLSSYNGNTTEKLNALFNLDSTTLHTTIMGSNDISKMIYEDIYSGLPSLNPSYTLDDKKTVFKEFAVRFYFLSSFCNTGVKITSNINITGITINDLITSYRMTVNAFNEQFVKQEIIKLSSWLHNNVIMQYGNRIYELNSVNNIQILLSLLNDRYKKNNFNKGITEFYNSILSRRYPRIIENINKELNVILEECDFVIDSVEDIGLMEDVQVRYMVEPHHIPYA